MWAAALGAVWLAARVWYVVNYLKDPALRAPPTTVSLLTAAALALGAAWGVIRGFW